MMVMLQIYQKKDKVHVLYVGFRKGGNRMAIYPKLFFTFTLICIVLINGCSKALFSPDNVITKELDTDENLNYYGELSARLEALEELDAVAMNEWRDRTMTRVDMNTPDG